MLRPPSVLENLFHPLMMLEGVISTAVHDAISHSHNVRADFHLQVEEFRHSGPWTVDRNTTHWAVRLTYSSNHIKTGLPWGLSFLAYADFSGRFSLFWNVCQREKRVPNARRTLLDFIESENCLFCNDGFRKKIHAPRVLSVGLEQTQKITSRCLALGLSWPNRTSTLRF